MEIQALKEMFRKLSISCGVTSPARELESFRLRKWGNHNH